MAGLALTLLACGGEAPKNAKKKKNGGDAQSTELTWQIRQFRLTEPCKGAGAAAPAAAVPPAGGEDEAATPAAPPPAPAAELSAPPAAPAAADQAVPAASGTDTAAPAPPPVPAGPAACVRFTAVYPEFETGLSRALLQRLDDAVKQLVTSPSFDERRAGSVDGTGRRLITAWKTRLQERSGPDKNLPMPPWYDDRKVAVLYRDRQVVSLKLEEKLFAGGAHELSTVLYESYSLDRVDRLSMADLFVEGSAQKLNELGEKKFREQRGIAPGRSLADAGFDFPGGIFRLSANFAVTQGGVAFRYNPYDVGPFALGATDLLLENAEIRELLRPRGPLGDRVDPAATAPATPAATPPADPAAAPTPPPAAAPPADEPASTEGG